MSQKQKLTLLIILNILIFSLLSFLVWQNIEVSHILKTNPLQITNHKENQMTDRAKTYTIITQKPKDPQIIEVKVDPFDVKEGETQIVTVKIKSTSPTVRSEDYVKGLVVIDDKSVNFPFELKKVEGEEEETITTWQGSWQLDGSIEKNFQIRILAENEKGENTVTITLK